MGVQQVKKKEIKRIFEKKVPMILQCGFPNYAVIAC